MRVTVKFQGIIADMLGRKSQAFELADGASVADLAAAITGGDATAETILKQTRAFIDGQQADRTALLPDGAEVIFMRPIAGGCDLRVAGRVSPSSFVLESFMPGGATADRMREPPRQPRPKASISECPPPASDAPRR